MIKWLWEGFKLLAVLVLAWFFIQIVQGCAVSEEMDEFERQTWEYERLSNMQYFTEACIGAGGVVRVENANHRSIVRHDARTVDDLRCVGRPQWDSR